MSGDAEGPWVEPDEARCGLLLLAPEAPGVAFEAELAAALATGAIVAYVAGADREAARPLCAEHMVALLALDELDPGADGVHLRDPAAMAEARRRLGPRAIIGASCGGSRHLAMVAGEEGGDYVLFGAGPDSEELVELCGWWSGLFVLPCAVEVDAIGPEVASYIAAGADFVAVREAVWGHQDGPAAALLLLWRQVQQGCRQRQDQA